MRKGDGFIYFKILLRQGLLRSRHQRLTFRSVILRGDHAGNPEERFQVAHHPPFRFMGFGQPTAYRCDDVVHGFTCVGVCSACLVCNAERCGMRYHAERGNERCGL